MLKCEMLIFMILVYLINKLFFDVSNKLLVFGFKMMIVYKSSIFFVTNYLLNNNISLIN